MFKTTLLLIIFVIPFNFAQHDVSLVPVEISFFIPKIPDEAVSFSCSFLAPETGQYHVDWTVSTLFPGPDLHSIVHCEQNQPCEHEDSWLYQIPGWHNITLTITHAKETIAQNSSRLFYPSKLDAVFIQAPEYAATNALTNFSVLPFPSEKETGIVTYTWFVGESVEPVVTTESYITAMLPNTGRTRVTVTARNHFGSVYKDHYITVEDTLVLDRFDVSATRIPVKSYVWFNFTVNGTDPEFFWIFSEKDLYPNGPSAVDHFFNDSGKFYVNVSAVNHVSVVFTGVTIDVFTPLPPGSKPAIATTVVVVVVMLFALALAAYRYQRLLFKRRGIEIADHSFAHDEDRSLSPNRSRIQKRDSWFSKSKPPQHYGTVEMFDL